jgi:hypothetical protein
MNSTAVPASNKTAKCRFFLLAGLSLLLVLLFAADGVRKGVDTVVPNYYRHTASLAIAISEAAHGTSGMVGLADVENALDKFGYGFNNPNGELLSVLNVHPDQADAALRAAADVAISDRTKIFGLMLNETGMIDYYYLAFELFGYHVRSIYALYVCVLAIMALSFIFAFRDCAVFIVPSIFYLLLLLVFQDAYPANEYGFGPLTNSRMLPYLSLYPVLFCLTLIGSSRHFCWVNALATAIAGLIFAFVANARTYSYWQAGPLALIVVIMVLARLVSWRLPLRKRVARFSVYPVLIFACCAGALIANHHWRRDLAVYSTATFAGHEYWLNYVVGTLPVFRWRVPELEQESGVTISGDDSYSGALVRIKIKERGERLDDYLVGDWWNQAKRDELARQIVFDLWRDYPGLMIKNYLRDFKPIVENLLRDVALLGFAILVVGIGPSRRLLWLLRAGLLFAVGGIGGAIALLAAGLRYVVPAARRLSVLVVPVLLLAICTVPTIIIMPYTDARMVDPTVTFTDPRMADVNNVIWLCLLICCCGLRIRVPRMTSHLAKGDQRAARRV